MTSSSFSNFKTSLILIGIILMGIGSLSFSLMNVSADTSENLGIVYTDLQYAEITYTGERMFGVEDTTWTVSEFSVNNGDLLDTIPELTGKYHGIAANLTHLMLAGYGLGNGTIYFYNIATKVIERSLRIYNTSGYSYGMEYYNGKLYLSRNISPKTTLLIIDANTGEESFNKTYDYRLTPGPIINGLWYLNQYDIDEFYVYDIAKESFVARFAPPEPARLWGMTQYKGLLVYTDVDNAKLIYIRVYNNPIGTVSFTTNVDPIGAQNFIVHNQTHLFLLNATKLTITEIGSSLTIRSIALGAWYNGFAFDGTNLWLAQNFDLYALVKMTTTGVVLATYNFGMTPANRIQGIAFDGKYLWFYLFNRTITQWDPVTQTFGKRFSINNHFAGLVYSPAQDLLWGYDINPNVYTIVGVDQIEGKTLGNMRIHVNGSSVRGIDIWEDKFIMYANLNGIWQLIYLQNDLALTRTNAELFPGGLSQIPPDLEPGTETLSLLEQLYKPFLNSNNWMAMGITAGIGFLLGGLIIGLASRKKK